MCYVYLFLYMYLIAIHVTTLAHPLSVHFPTTTKTGPVFVMRHQGHQIYGECIVLASLQSTPTIGRKMKMKPPDHEGGKEVARTNASGSNLTGWRKVEWIVEVETMTTFVPPSALETTRQLEDVAKT